MRRLAPLTVFGALAAVLVPPAHAVDYTVDLSYPNADQWAKRAAPFLLALGPKDNGRSLTVS